MASPRTAHSYGSYDLDSDASYQAVLANVASGESGNFAIIFNRKEASASTDLNQDDMKQWLQDHKDADGVRWIHFWSGPDQRPAVEDVCRQYDISPRLLSLICPQRSAAHAAHSTVLTQNTAVTRLLTRPSWTHRPKDVEKAAELSSAQKAASAKLFDVKDLSFVDIFDSIWHFHSVDWGHKYVHIGVNVLSVIPGLEQHRMADQPAGQRLWTSIILCDDGSVISSFERPPHHQSEEINKASNAVVKRHVLNLVKQISRLAVVNSPTDGDLMNVMIRPDPLPLSSTPVRMSDSERMEYAGLLFYYLFDDWMTTFSLIAQREHPYRQSLEIIRRDLANAPDAELLETLHSIGRQLTVLQLMYQSYGTVITRLLQRYRHMSYLAANNFLPQQNHGHSGMATSMPTTYQDPTFHSSQVGISSFSAANSTVQLSFLAMGRFERLLDRVHLYALNEIEHCLVEKESLVFMTFNLLTLSESHSVEKLTRTTILLTKATMLFLPVSLLTAYFSLSIGNIETLYSLKTYWLSFLVVTLISLVFLYAFGLATGTIEGKIVYRSLHKALWEKSIAAIVRRQKKP